MTPKKRTPRRPPRGVEAHMDLDRMHVLFDGAAESIAYGTSTERRIVAASLAKTAVRAVREGKPEEVFGDTYGADELRLALEERLQRYVQAGRRQVAGELARQAGGQRQAVRLAEPKKRTRAASRAAAAVKAAALAMAVGITARMRGEAAVVAASRQAAALTEAEIERRIMAAGDDHVLRMSAMVHDLVSAGRAVEAEANADRIANCIQSAILDGNTCEACEEGDGRETTDLAEAEGWTPVPDCAGGDRCRCVTVFELKQ